MRLSIVSFFMFLICFSATAQDDSVLANYWEAGYMNINSGYDDFCPAVFNRGLIFVTNRGRTKPNQYLDVKNKTFFSSLFYVYDTGRIRSTVNPIWKRTPTRPPVFTGSSNDSRLIASRSGAAPLPDNVSFLKVDEEMNFFDNRVNNRYHDGPLSFNKREDTMYITRNRKGASKKSADRLYIQVLILRYGDWLPAGQIPASPADYSIGHPALHPQGHLLYFVSDMPGGQGGKDLWYCEKLDSGWSAPVNAGALVNTGKDEMFPYFSPNGTLYFSSDGRGGEGGLDIFQVKLNGHLPTGNVLHMGTPVNSPKDDFGIWIGKEGYHGYFSSNRYGTDDVFELSPSRNR